MLQHANYSATCSDSMCHCEYRRYCLEGFVSCSSIRNEDAIGRGELVNQLCSLSNVVRRKNPVSECKSFFRARQKAGSPLSDYRHYLVCLRLFGDERRRDSL